MSCQLINSDMERFILDQADYNGLLDELDGILDILAKKQHMHCGNLKNNVLILQGEVMVRMNFQVITEKIFKIIEFCEVVLCCRCSPRQKHDLIKNQIQQFPREISMAIGDGANDVDMINASHIGIGIRGLDGRHASKNSDISIPEFHVLRSLLFVHGREFCRKNTNQVFFSFYFNMLLIMNQLWYASSSSFDGVLIINQHVQNMIALGSCLPIIVFALNDTEYKEKVLFDNNIRCYQENIMYTHFNRSFFKWLLNALFDSLIIFKISEAVFSGPFCTREGEQFQFNDFAMFVSLQSALLINIKVMMLLFSFSIMNVLIIGVAMTFIVTCSPLTGDHTLSMMASPIVFLLSFICICFTVLISYFFTLFKRISGRFIKIKMNKIRQEQGNKGLQGIQQQLRELTYVKRLKKLWELLLEEDFQKKKYNKLDNKEKEIRIEMQLGENSQTGLIFSQE